MNQAVLIIDLDKLDKNEWKKLWNGAGVSIHRVQTEEGIKQVVQFIDKIQDEELEKHNQEVKEDENKQ